MASDAFQRSTYPWEYFLELLFMVKTTFQPSNSEAVVSTPKTDLDSSSPETQSYPWRRLVVGGACVALGLVAASVGLASITYRLTHLRVSGGLVNGRAVRIQAPADGTIQDFYARPGVQVQAGQVLTRLGSAPLPSKGVVKSVQDPMVPAQIAADRQILDSLNQQLQELESQYQALQTTTVTIAEETIDQSEAAMAAAIAQETAARNKYERFRLLLEAGAVSRQEVDELEAAWKNSPSRC